MIKNIVFDYGGVVLSEDDNWVVSQEVKNLLNKPEEELWKGWKAAWPNGRDGVSSENEFFETFLKTVIGKSETELIDKLKEIYRNKIETLEAFSVLPKLQGRYKIFAITNITKDWLELKRNVFDLDKYFDLIISSCGEGIAKPHTEIFESLLKKASLKPEECLFIDNLEKNISPAQKVGYKTILFENLDQLIQEMKNFEITL